jgi:hypothetical protein
MVEPIGPRRSFRLERVEVDGSILIGAFEIAGELLIVSTRYGQARQLLNGRVAEVAAREILTEMLRDLLAGGSQLTT